MELQTKTITKRILKCNPMIKKPIVINYTFFTIITWFIIIIIQHLLDPFIKSKTNLYKTQYRGHQDNRPSACLQMYKRNCLNVLVGSICFHKYVKIQ